MCGFVAIIGENQVCEDKLLSNMRDSLYHRGPNKGMNWKKQYEEGSVSFGFRRLMIIDTSENGSQPMFDELEEIGIVFIGEIYNYKELKIILENKNYKFKSQTDTEVLINAYKEWGFDLVKYINGMYSFIIWDSKRKKAFIARDRFGEKPLYWTKLKNNTFVFSSEIKSMLLHPEIKCEFNTDYVMKSLPISSSETIFKNIFQFNPASLAIIDLKKPRLSIFKYWSSNLRPNLDISNSSADLEFYKSYFYGLIYKSVNDRFNNCDVKVGLMLSGGIDSSLLAGLLSFDKKIDTFSVVFEDGQNDESEFINKTIKMINSNHFSIKPKLSDILLSFRDVHIHQETINLGPSITLEWILNEYASSLGYRVLLSGQGGDELFGGYQDHQKMLIEYQKLVNQPDRALTSRTEYDFKNYPEFNQNLIQLCKNYNSCFRGYLDFDINSLSLQNNVHFGDRSSMAHSIELRHPYLDYNLFDVAKTLPDNFLIKDGYSKYLLRLIGKDNVKNIPWEIFDSKKKIGFELSDMFFNNKDYYKWIKNKLTRSSFKEYFPYQFQVSNKLIDQNPKEITNTNLGWYYSSISELSDIFDKNEWNSSKNFISY